MGEKRRKSSYRRIRADSGQQRRIRFVMAVLGAAAFLPVTVRLFGLMVTSYDVYSALALRNQSRTTVTASARGVIYDRNMNILAGSKTVEHVYIDPRELEQTGADIEGMASALSGILEVDGERVKKLARDKSLRYHLIADRVEEDAAAQIRAYIEKTGIEGIHLEPNSSGIIPTAPWRPRSSASPMRRTRALRASRPAMTPTSPARPGGPSPPRATTRWICPSPWSSICWASPGPTW